MKQSYNKKIERLRIYRLTLLQKDMKKNTIIFFLFISAAFTISVIQAQVTEPILKVGLIADIQYGDCETSGSRFYRSSINKLRDAVKEINGNNVSFTVNLGDFTDRNLADLNAVMIELGMLNANMYSVIGNHDYVGVKDNQVLYNKLFLPSDYYSLDLPRLGMQFLFLNSNEISSYSNVLDTAKQVELDAIKTKLKAENRENNYSWNGALSNEQLNWLDNKLKWAHADNVNVIICMHHPLYPENNHNTLNDREVLDVIGKYDCVKAVLSGHNHAGNFGYYKGIPFITVEGMIETEGDNAYGIIEIFKDKIVVKGRGRVTSRELIF